MVEVSIKIENLGKFVGALQKSPTVAAKHLQKAINTAGNVFLASTREVIRTGRNMWKSPFDTGYMWNNIYLTILPLRAEIIPRADYSIYVHEGTYKMQSRPFLKITEDLEASNINGLFENALDDMVNEIARSVNG